MNENDEDQNGENPLEVDLEFRGELEPLTFIGLGKILVKAPAPLRDAEQKVDQRTNRQQQVRDDEVLAVQNIARADDVDVRPDIVAKHARKTQNEKRYTANERCLFPVPTEGVHADGKNVLKDGKHRRKACKDHKQEEQRAPDAAAGHIDKDVRKGLEDKRRALIGLNAKGEAGGEDDRARHESDERIERADAHGLAGQGVGLCRVASEDLHRCNAKAQRKERLVHRARNDRAESVLLDALGRRQQIELHALCRAGERQTVNGKDENQTKKRQHHDLGHALQTVLQTEAANEEACDDDNFRPERHLTGLREHGAEYAAGFFGAHSGVERADEEFSKVADHPAGNGSVIHHQHHAAKQAEPAVDVPLRALGL